MEIEIMLRPTSKKGLMIRKRTSKQVARKLAEKRRLLNYTQLMEAQAPRPKKKKRKSFRDL